MVHAPGNESVAPENRAPQRVDLIRGTVKSRSPTEFQDNETDIRNGMIISSEWGWNPGTFEAIGTVSASAVAFIALIVALVQAGSRRKFELLLRERDAERESRLVRMSLTSYVVDDTTEHTLLLTNQSPLPIYPIRMVVTALTSISMSMEKRIFIPPNSTLRWAGISGLPTSWQYRIFGNERRREMYFTGLPENLGPGASFTVDFVVLPRPKPRSRWDGGGSWFVHVEFDNGYGETRSTKSRSLDGTQLG